ncbi:hypothetical protein BSL78_15919 [Apostichopus japonicus]|uniref:Essential for reactive oxygen species protein n=1 Tax=Stichopus japonicus TaxID=307972 RepID=A0A2G8KGY1_STIJA|nr:hypothetical protein BSL78_15919 [Apostichopus japonicus]
MVLYSAFDKYMLLPAFYHRKDLQKQAMTDHHIHKSAQQICFFKVAIVTTSRILSIGLGVVVFSHEDDSMLWKLFCFSCGVLGAFLSLDDWEECILDRKKDLVQLKRLSLVERVVFARKESCNVVTAPLSHVIDAQMAEDEVKFFGKAKYLLLVFKDGYSLPLTIKATRGSGENHLAVLNFIQDFLQICEADRSTEPIKIEKSELPEEEDNSSTTSSSSCSFEKLPADEAEEIEIAS